MRVFRTKIAPFTGRIQPSPQGFSSPVGIIHVDPRVFSKKRALPDVPFYKRGSPHDQS